MAATLPLFTQRLCISSHQNTKHISPFFKCELTLWFVLALTNTTIKKLYKTLQARAFRSLPRVHCRVPLPSCCVNKLKLACWMIRDMSPSQRPIDPSEESTLADQQLTADPWVSIAKLQWPPSWTNLQNCESLSYLNCCSFKPLILEWFVTRKNVIDKIREFQLLYLFTNTGIVQCLKIPFKGFEDRDHASYSSCNISMCWQYQSYKKLSVRQTKPYS